MSGQIEPDTDVVAELHYTRFGSADVFAALARRHGLKCVGVLEDNPSTPFWWGKDLNTDGQISMQTGCQPITGEHVSGGYRDEGYASYVHLAGPVYAAEPLYRDIIETAEYIKGEFRPLSTTESDEADRTTVLSGRDIGVPKTPSSNARGSGPESMPHREPHPDESWARYQEAPVCDECGGREAMQPASVVNGNVTDWACFDCSAPDAGAAGERGER